MVGSWSDHSRIMVGSFSDPARIGPALEMTFQQFSRNFWESFQSQFAWQAQYSVMLRMPSVVPRIVNNVSYVTRISHDSHFVCQAQYLVSLDNDTCCSAHCK